jgi:hypothetical protein
MDLEPSIFSLQMSLNRRSFDIDEAPCKVDGGREYNNAVMCNCYVICSDKEVLDSATIPGVSLECKIFLGAKKQGNVCIPGVIYANNSNQSGLEHQSI